MYWTEATGDERCQCHSQERSTCTPFGYGSSRRSFQRKFFFKHELSCPSAPATTPWLYDEIDQQLAPLRDHAFRTTVFAPDIWHVEVTARNTIGDIMKTFLFEVKFLPPPNMPQISLVTPSLMCLECTDYFHHWGDLNWGSMPPLWSTFYDIQDKADGLFAHLRRSERISRARFHRLVFYR